MACIDAHAHLSLREGAAATLLSSMDRHGIERAFVVGGGLIDPLQLSERLEMGPMEDHRTTFDNSRLRSICEPYGNRLLPFFFANPWQDLQDYRAAGPGFYGLKLAPAIHGMPLSHPYHHEYYSVAGELRHPVYLHCLAFEGFRVDDLVGVAKEHPTTTFILGHAGVGNLDFAAVRKIAATANVAFETSGGFAAVITFAVKTLGAHRVLFGSEYPLQDPESELVKITNLTLSDADMALVKGANASAMIAGACHVF